MRALGGQEPSAIETIMDNGIGFSAVSSRSLKPYLFRSVPEAAAQINIALNQDPDSIVESQPPKYIVKILQHPGTLRQPPAPVDPILSVGGPALILKTTMGNLNVAPEVAAYASLDDPQLKEDINQILAARGRVSFETHTGFTVVGEPIVNVQTNGISFDVFSEHSVRGELNQIRIDPGGESRTILVQFASGTGACLAVLPGFIGTVTVEEGVVTNVSYTPSQNTNR
jgi:hypothetical protein